MQKEERLVCDEPSVNEVSQLRGEGGGVWHPRGPPLDHQLQLLEDVDVLGERVGELPNSQLKLRRIRPERYLDYSTPAERKVQRLTKVIPKLQTSDLWSNEGFSVGFILSGCGHQGGWGKEGGIKCVLAGVISALSVLAGVISASSVLASVVSVF